MTSGIPTWLAIAAAAAAVVGAIAIVGAKLRQMFKAIAKFVKAVNTMVPMVQRLTTTFADSPRAFGVLDDIARQFGTDSGSSLRDAIDRLETTAAENREAAALLKVGVEASRQLAVQDRADYRAILESVAFLKGQVAAGDTKLDQAAAERQHIATALEQQQPPPEAKP